MAKNANLQSGKVKGGTRFPLYGMSVMREWIKKLVSKTHLEPQPQDLIFSGVVGSKGPTGQIKVSALKQFGLIQGNSKAYSATDLSKKINSSPEDELLPLLRKAVLAPPVFKQIFDTFQGDTVSVAKLRQRASDLGVHPDKTESCIAVYVDSLEQAGLVSRENENIEHRSSEHLVVEKESPSTSDADDEVVGQTAESTPQQREDTGSETSDQGLERTGSGRAVIHVNVNLDSSLDTEKLSKQLELLRRYGAL